MKAIKIGKSIIRIDKREVDKTRNVARIEFCLALMFGEIMDRNTRLISKLFLADVQKQEDREQDEDSARLYDYWKNAKDEEIIEGVYAALQRYLPVFKQSWDFQHNEENPQQEVKVTIGEETYYEIRPKPNPYEKQLTYEAMDNPDYENYWFPYWQVQEMVWWLVKNNYPIEVQLVEV